MVTTLQRDDLGTLGRGFRALGSGGGGSTTLWELTLSRDPAWSAQVFSVAELDPATPCVAVSFAGSTLLLDERPPGQDPFAELIAAAERWTGVAAHAVCWIEGAGLNGLSPFTVSGERALVDADLMGRALPLLEQTTLLVDRLPGVVTVSESGAGGLVVIDTQRAADTEAVVRSAIVQAGGAAAVVMAGFTVGDLAEHAITGGVARAYQLGGALADTSLSLPELADRWRARLLGVGQITATAVAPNDPFASSIEIRGDDGSYLHLVARSESLAFMRDGLVEAATPDILVTIDSRTREVLQVMDLLVTRHVAVFGLAAPPWWRSTPERLRQVSPSRYDLPELELELELDRPDGVRR